MIDIKKLVDRFLAWPLPKSVCSDTCVTDPSYPHPRIGTNLLTAAEAEQMLRYVLEQIAQECSHDWREIDHGRKVCIDCNQTSEPGPHDA